MTRPAPTRADAIRRLARFGIRGAEVYLVDLIPLIEIAWADGCVQPEEIEELHACVRRHVARLNGLAGHAMLAEADGLAFVDRFVHERPPAELLAELRELVAPVRLGSSSATDNDALRRSLLAECLQIAASAPAPDGRRRISERERRTFVEILDALDEPAAG